VPTAVPKQNALVGRKMMQKVTPFYGYDSDGHRNKFALGFGETISFRQTAFAFEDQGQ
jgi:hypothetical protein